MKKVVYNYILDIDDTLTDLLQIILKITVTFSKYTRSV